METIFWIGWFASGLVGGTLMFANYRFFMKTGTYCPSPAAICGILFTSFFGPVLLATGIIVWVFDLIEMNEDSWWKRPICRR